MKCSHAYLEEHDPNANQEKAKESWEGSRGRGLEKGGWVRDGARQDGIEPTPPLKRPAHQEGGEHLEKRSEKKTGQGVHRLGGEEDWDPVIRASSIERGASTA